MYYSLPALQDEFKTLVGFRQSDALKVDLPGELTTASSGLYVDQYHPLITYPNLLATVRMGPNYLNPDQDVANKLREVIQDSIAQVLSDVNSRKLSRMEGKNILADTPLYDGEGSVFQTIDGQGRFVGLRITVANPYRPVTLRRIGFQVVGGVTNLNFYVYADSQFEPVAIIPATFSGTGRMQWFDLPEPVVMKGFSAYTVGYYQTDLGSAKAVRRDRTIDIQSCAACSPQNAYLRSQWKPFLSVRASRIDATRLDPERNLWVENSADLVDEMNYGINLTVRVECDLTDFLIAQKKLFAPAIQQKATVRLLNEIAYSTNTTNLEQMTRDKAIFALKNGEEAKYDQLIGNIDMEFSGLDPRCMPEMNSIKFNRKSSMF